MLNYKYKAVSESGQTIEGYYEAQSKNEVLAMLKSNNYLPISIEEEIGVEVTRDLLRKKITKKDLAIFCRQFYTMLDAGIDIVECLNILNRQTENRTLKKTVGLVYEDVLKGLALSEAMASHERIFPKLLTNMLAAGEASGNLDVIMERMAVHFEKEFYIENKVKNALVYPIALSFVAIGVVVFLLTVVMPTFIGMFESSSTTLPAPTRALLTLSDLLRNYWYLFIIGLGLLVTGILAFGRSQFGRSFYDNLKIKLPGIRTMNTKIITSRFTRTMSTLLSSGIPLLQALEIVAKVVGNRVVGDKIQSAQHDIRRGAPMSTTIRDMEVFPPMVDSMVSIGEESGALDDMLYKTADFYDEEVETAMERMTTLLEPLLIVFMALVIGFIVIAMALPMFDLVNTMDF